MDDMISRQDAIYRIESHIRTGDELYPLTDTDKILNHAFEIAASCVYNLPSVQPEIVRCKDCRWGREVCGNIECFVDSNIPPEYHGYEWFCPNGERRTDE